MEQISNWRDAGLQSMTKNQVFRCASLDQATKADIQHLVTTHKIHTILDLRGGGETLPGVDQQTVSDFFSVTTVPEAQPDRRTLIKINLAHCIRNHVWKSVSLYICLIYVFWSSLGFTKHAKKVVLQASILKKEGLLGLNKAIILHGSKYLKQVFDVLADRKSYPIVVHCTAGKDRTGLVIALLQSIADVDRTEIVKE